MADVTKEIALKVVATDATGPALESLEDKLNAAKKRMVELAAAGKQNTEEFRQLQAEAGNYKRIIEGVEQSVDSFSKGGSKALTLVVEASQAVGAGFAIAQGAAALFGDENEDLQKAMLKVQGAIALVNGVQQINVLLTQKSVITTEAAAAAQKIYAFAVGTSTGAMRAFRLALLATGIGAFVVVLGFAAEAMGLFGTNTKDTTKDLEAQKKALEDNKAAADAYTRLLKAQGVDEISLNKRRISSIEGELKVRQMALDDFVKGRVAANAVINGLNKKETEALVNNLKAEKLELEKNNRDIIKQQTDKTTQLNNELLAIQKRYQDQLAILNADALNKELLAIDQKYEADLARLKKAGRNTADLEAIIRKEKLHKEKEFAIELRNVQQEHADKQKEADDKQEQDSIARMQREGARRTAQANNELEGQKKRLEDQKFIEEQKVKLASDGFNTIGELANAFAGSSEESQKRAFNVNKAAGIAQTIIDTFAAAQGAYKSQMTVPDPSAPIRASVAAGIAIAQGLARVAAISKTQFKSTSTGTPPPTPAGTSSSTPAPTFTNPQTTNLGTGELSGGQGQGSQPMRAYVVERDIQQTTSRVRRLSEFATLG